MCLYIPKGKGSLWVLSCESNVGHEYFIPSTAGNINIYRRKNHGMLTVLTLYLIFVYFSIFTFSMSFKMHTILQCEKKYNWFVKYLDTQISRSGYSIGLGDRSLSDDTKMIIHVGRGRDSPAAMSLHHNETNLRHTEASLTDCHIVHELPPYSTQASAIQRKFLKSLFYVFKNSWLDFFNKVA